MNPLRFWFIGLEAAYILSTFCSLPKVYILNFHLIYACILTQIKKVIVVIFLFFDIKTNTIQKHIKISKWKI